MTPNLSPIGSLSITYKKRQAENIDSENMRLMRKIMEAGSAISELKLDEGYLMHKKYKKIVKKALKQGFDLDKLVDHQRRVFGHVESKTSAAKLFPPIGSRSKSTLNMRK